MVRVSREELSALGVDFRVGVEFETDRLDIDRGRWRIVKLEGNDAMLRRLESRLPPPPTPS